MVGRIKMFGASQAKSSRRGKSGTDRRGVVFVWNSVDVVRGAPGPGGTAALEVGGTIADWATSTSRLGLEVFHGTQVPGALLVVGLQAPPDGPTGLTDLSLNVGPENFMAGPRPFVIDPKVPDPYVDHVGGPSPAELWHYAYRNPAGSPTAGVPEAYRTSLGQWLTARMSGLLEKRGPEEEQARDDVGAQWAVMQPSEVRDELHSILARVSRLETVATMYGMDVDGLLDALEIAADGVHDPANSVSAAELAALREAGISLEGPEDDPTGSTQVLLGEARMLRFRSEALSVKDAAAVLNVTAQRVRQLLGSGDAVSFPGDDGGHLMPAWQFADGRLVPGLRALVDIIDAAHPLTVAAFMTRPDPDLEVGLEGDAASPVDWLVGGGDPDAVVALALRLLTAA